MRLAFGVVARSKLTVVMSVHDTGDNGQMVENYNDSKTTTKSYLPEFDTF